MPERRFPPSWTVEEKDACFIVRDKNRHALAYMYYETEQGRRTAAYLLTKDEARRMAANICEVTRLAGPPSGLGRGRPVPPRVLALPLAPPSDHSLRGNSSGREAGIGGRNFHTFRCEGNN